MSGVKDLPVQCHSDLVRAIAVNWKAVAIECGIGPTSILIDVVGGSMAPARDCAELLLQRLRGLNMPLGSLDYALRTIDEHECADRLPGYLEQSQARAAATAPVAAPTQTQSVLAPRLARPTLAPVIPGTVAQLTDAQRLQICREFATAWWAIASSCNQRPPIIQDTTSGGQLAPAIELAKTLMSALQKESYPIADLVAALRVSNLIVAADELVAMAANVQPTAEAQAPGS